MPQLPKIVKRTDVKQVLMLGFEHIVDHELSSLPRWTVFTVRDKIRDGHSDYPVTAWSWPIFYYVSYTCDRNDLEKSPLRSRILVKVNGFYYIDYFIDDVSRP